MNRPLDGTTIWCTRPGRAGERSCYRLHELGATIHHAPTLQIQPVVPAPAELAVLHRVASRCVVALTSPGGVSNFVLAAGAVRPDGRPWPAVAVGQRTAIEAKSLGLDLVATSPRATARDLVPCVLGASEAAIVVIPGSNIRRAELADGLREHGREVLELLVQETIPLEGLPAGAPAELSAVDLIVAYSPSALAFVQSLPDQQRADVLSIPVAVMGPTTAAAARQLGFEVAVEPRDPHEDQLVGMICRWALDQS